MKEEKIIIVACVQCGEKLREYLLLVPGGQIILNYCKDPKCPNYALFQVGTLHSTLPQSVQ